MSTEESKPETPPVEEVAAAEETSPAEEVIEDPEPEVQTLEDLAAEIAAAERVDTSKYNIMKPLPKVERPDKKAHDDAIAAVNEALKQLECDREEITAKIEAIHAANKNSELTGARDAFNILRREKSELLTERKGIMDRRDHVRKSMDSLMIDQKSLRSGLKITSLEGIIDRLAELKRLQETTSMSLSQEKKLLKEMEVLKASKKQVSKLSAFSNNIGSQKDDLKSVQEEARAKNKQLDDVSARINTQLAILDSLKEKDKGSRDQIPTLIAERDAVRDTMTEKKNEIKEHRDEFKNTNNDWYDLQRAQRAQKKFKEADQQRLYIAEKSAREKTRAEEELKKIPYEIEMALCVHLAKYLTTTFVVPTSANKPVTSEKKPEVIAVTEDPFAGFKPMKKKTDDIFLEMGGCRKNIRKRVSKQNKKTAVDQPFRLNMEVFDEFSVLGLTPPTAVEAVAGSIDELMAKKKWYSEQPRGSVPTLKEIRDAERESKKKSVSKSSNGKKSSKKFALSSDDFAPLSDNVASTSTIALNSTWGQKPAMVAPPQLEFPPVQSAEQGLAEMALDPIPGESA